MRFYQIKILKNDALWIPPSMKALGATDASYTSFVNGQHLTSALDISFDIPIAYADAPEGGEIVKVYGCGLQDLAQSTNLVGCKIEIRAGMKKGLPLAIPKTPDIIVKAHIESAWGEWNGPVIALNMLLRAGDEDDPAVAQPNVTFHWLDGQPMANAIAATLRNSFTNPNLQIAISDKLKVKGNQDGFYGTLGQFASAVKQYTMAKQFAGLKRLDGTPWQGVQIRLDGDTIVVSDGTVAADTLSIKQLDFIDLIGQPSWQEQDLIQVTTVLRGDIQLDDVVKLPSSLKSPYVVQSGTTAPYENGDPSGSANPLIFQGSFSVESIHHHARFRQADAPSWTTLYTMSTPSTDPATDTTKPAAGSQPSATNPTPPPAAGDVSLPFGGTLINKMKQQPKADPPQNPTPANKDFA